MDLHKQQKHTRGEIRSRLEAPLKHLIAKQLITPPWEIVKATTVHLKVDEKGYFLNISAIHDISF